MNVARPVAGQPAYDVGPHNMCAVRGPLAESFARQILLTCQPFLRAKPGELDILDVGCGYGQTAAALARVCRSVIGIEPSHALFTHAARLRDESGLANLEYRHQSVFELCDESCYDLAILDNVLEHLFDQPLALRKISSALKPGGVLFVLVPNKLWPVEVHYRLPFLSYLPLRLANLYLRTTGRGSDYTDASFAPTYWRLKRLLSARTELEYRFVLPADLALTTAGRAWHYRAGAAAIRRVPCLWSISKAFLVVAVKHAVTCDA
jgi:2-polyprenyl-3-methyl-5-hydroxy-6-metoxy-1,4-benzoquinol methylase